MAMPLNRLSDPTVESEYLDPDVRLRTLNRDFESGPLAVGDTSLGNQYQPWEFYFESGEFIAVPETSGSPQVILAGQDSKWCSFAFDQNARIYIFWTDTAGLCRLYWYDSVAEDFVITEFPSIYQGMLSLDDKRLLQSSTNDILLWYTRQVSPGEFNLYHRRQRDRFTVEYLMRADTFKFIQRAGMNEGLRGQVFVTNTPVGIDNEPPVNPIAQANLDFELGDVFWSKIGAASIVGGVPGGGAFSGRIDGDAAPYSALTNNVKTALGVSSSVAFSGDVIGTENTLLSIGVVFYNSADAAVLDSGRVVSVTTSWNNVSGSLPAPAAATSYSLRITTNFTNGVVNIDNIEVTP